MICHWSVFIQLFVHVWKATVCHFIQIVCARLNSNILPLKLVLSRLFMHIWTATTCHWNWSFPDCLCISEQQQLAIEIGLFQTVYAYLNSNSLPLKLVFSRLFMCIWTATTCHWSWSFPDYLCLSEQQQLAIEIGLIQTVYAYLNSNNLPLKLVLSRLCMSEKQ